MRKAFAALAAALGVLIVVGLWFAPVSEPESICHVIDQWDGAKAGWRLNHPMALAWGDGFLYVADSENGSIKKLRDGELIAEWKGFERPVAIALAPGALYVADFITNRIVKLDRTSGARLTVLSGEASGELDAPSGIAIDDKGFVYLSDFYHHRVQKRTADGVLVKQWGTRGRWNGEFRYPTDLALGPAGDLLVADSYNHRVQRFSLDGGYLGKWGGPGYGLSGQWSGWFRLTKAIAIDSATGAIYIADAFNHRIQKFSASGQARGAWGASDHALRYPSGVAVDAQGSVYVSDFFENRIWKLACR